MTAPIRTVQDFKNEAEQRVAEWKSANNILNLQCSVIQIAIDKNIPIPSGVGEELRSFREYVNTLYERASAIVKLYNRFIEAAASQIGSR